MTDFTEELRDVLRRASEQVNQCNLQNGWFDHTRTPLEGHMLIVTEVAELSEAWRVSGFDDTTTSPNYHHIMIESEVDPVATLKEVPKPEGYGSECADILIRLLDQCSRDGVDLAFEFSRKLEYNRTRGKYHGGKKI